MSHARLRCRSAFVLAFAWMLTFTPAARADEADAFFDKGNAAYDAGKYEDALAHFGAAWKLRKTHDLAATMAQAEIKLGRHADACTHLAYALAHFPLTSKVEVKTRMEAALAEAKKNVATVRLQPSVKDAAVKLDGIALDPDRARDSETFVSAGHHVIEATAAGYQPVSVALDTKAGTAQDVALSFVPEETGARAPFLIVGGLVAGATLITGVTMLGVANAGITDAKKQRDELVAASGRRACDGAATEVQCKKIADSLQSAQTQTNVGAAMCIGAGAVAGATILYALLGRSKTAPPVQAGAMFTPQAGGMFLRGSF